jgi:3-phenylpropionate/trans-cinnamate dioxygenase ferredoxin subunit
VSEASFVRVGAIVEVPDGEIRGYEVPGGHVAVARLERELFAFADECPGDGCPLSDGELDGIADAIVCPCDGTAFDLRTGEPMAGPTADRLPLYLVRVSEDWIEIGPEIGGTG